MDFSAIITLSLAVFALALKPGPGMMMVMSRTMAQGIPACLAFCAGFLLVTFLYLCLVFVGFHLSGLDMTFIVILIKTIAAAYLIYLGIKSLLDIELEYTNNIPKTHSFFETFSAAAMLTFSNPLVIVFYAGILPTLLDISTLNLNDMTIIALIVLGIEGGMVLLYCVPLALFSKKIPVRFLKGVRIFSSIMIILIGLYIGYTTLPARDILSVF